MKFLKLIIPCRTGNITILKVTCYTTLQVFLSQLIAFKNKCLTGVTQTWEFS